MVHQVSYLGYIHLKWSNLAHSLEKLAFLDPFLDPLIDFLDPQHILKHFKINSGHISYSIDQKNGPSSDFPSLDRPQIAQFSS